MKEVSCEAFVKEGYGWGGKQRGKIGKTVSAKAGSEVLCMRSHILELRHSARKQNKKTPTKYVRGSAPFTKMNFSLRKARQTSDYAKGTTLVEGGWGGGISNVMNICTYCTGSCVFPSR